MIRKDFQYKKIKNFISKDEVELLNNYSIIKHRANTMDFDFRQNPVGDTYFIYDAAAEALLFKKKEFMEKETGLKLWPSYSYWRLYTYSSDLKDHTDRPSCEISVTVMLGSDGTPWPIYMGDTPIELEPGDACIYLGCEINHRREEFEGDWHSQVFLHYVDKNGPYADKTFDGRPIIL